MYSQLKATGTLQWRLVPLQPAEHYRNVISIAEYPSMLTKTVRKSGLSDISLSEVVQHAKQSASKAKHLGITWLRSFL